MRRFAFIAFALALIAARPLFAADDAQERQEKDDICAPLDNASALDKSLYEGRLRSYGCQTFYWRSFKAKPARDLLEPAALQVYERTLRQSDCDTALALLANAFAAAHPRAPSILSDKETSSFWRLIVIEKAYPELQFCLARREMREAQAEIERRGLSADRYLDVRSAAWSHAWPWPEPPEPVRRRNGVVHDLMELARMNAYATPGETSFMRPDGYLPAALELARLSHEGKVIRFVPEFQYYLLRILLLRGVERDQLVPMLAAAEARLEPSQIEHLQQQVREGEYRGERMTE